MDETQLAEATAGALARAPDSVTGTAGPGATAEAVPRHTDVVPVRRAATHILTSRRDRQD
ncbi:hypothetical protein ACIF9R_20495 [Streptomyces sp. NPDC086080]|uniref:hypothetical protein n=1 Tax=Streptomyces sp. NPDC086080 TaxID=3365748 RepID=UPI0037CFF940